MNQHTLETIEPKYYARIPNMAIDDLNYAELALYVYYKRIASEHGKCWQATATIAKSLGMTNPKLRKTRDSLSKKGFIKVSPRENDDGVEFGSKTITITNIWKTNVERFTPSPENVLPLERKRPTPRAKTLYEEEPISKTIKEKRLSATSAEGSLSQNQSIMDDDNQVMEEFPDCAEDTIFDGDTCPTCNEPLTHTVIEKSGEQHHVCLCQKEDQTLITMSKPALAKLKRDIEARLPIGDNPDTDLIDERIPSAPQRIIERHNSGFKVGVQNLKKAVADGQSLDMDAILALTPSVYGDLDKWNEMMTEVTAPLFDSKPDPFEDKNDPNAPPPTPLHVKPSQLFSSKPKRAQLPPAIDYTPITPIWWNEQHTEIVSRALVSGEFQVTYINASMKQYADTLASNGYMVANDNTYTLTHKGNAIANAPVCKETVANMREVEKRIAEQKAKPIAKRSKSKRKSKEAPTELHPELQVIAEALAQARYNVPYKNVLNGARYGIMHTAQSFFDDGLTADDVNDVQKFFDHNGWINCTPKKYYEHVQSARTWKSEQTDKPKPRQAQELRIEVDEKYL